MDNKKVKISMNFPNVRYEYINSYLIDYVDMLSSALKEIDTEKLDHAIVCINPTITKGGNIFLAGTEDQQLFQSFCL